MREELDIIQVLEDPSLFGQFIEDQSTWAAWKTVFRAFFGLPAVGSDLDLFTTCTGRTEWPGQMAKELWLAIGVRGGKSFAMALLACFLAVFRRYKLSPGELGYILIVAPTRRQAGIIWRYLLSLFKDIAFLSPFLLSETREEIQLTNNISILVMSSDYRSLRGFTAVAGIIDEVAYLSAEGQRPDIEVVRALRGRLVSTRGPLIAISSPYAKTGTLYDTYKRHFGKDDSPILVWQASSLTMNPTLDAEAIDQAHLEDPDGATADYDAKFRNDIESFVTREAVDAVTVPGRYEIPCIPGIPYYAFCDPSGGSKDSMTLAISHREKNIRVLDCVREVRPPFSPDQVCQDFAKTLKSYHLHSVVGDRYGGEWPRERFMVHGVKYRVSKKTKNDIYKELLPLINSGEVELLDIERMINQLCNLERRTGRGGRDSIDHPPTGHDDLINAAAGVLAGSQAKKIAGSVLRRR